MRVLENATPCMRKLDFWLLCNFVDWQVCEFLITSYLLQFDRDLRQVDLYAKRNSSCVFMKKEIISFNFGITPSSIGWIKVTHYFNGLSCLSKVLFWYISSTNDEQSILFQPTCLYVLSLPPSIQNLTSIPACVGSKYLCVLAHLRCP